MNNRSWGWLCVPLALVLLQANVAVAGAGTGDANGDGLVDGGDYVIWCGQYQQRGDGLASDFNGDRVVDGRDYVLWASAFGRRYFYVAVGGDDSGAGTWSDPWRTIQRAADVAAAGETVLVAAGVYGEPWTARHSGTATAPIRFAGAGAGATIVDGSGHSANCYYNDGHDHVEIAGFTMCNSYRDGVDVKNAAGVVFEDCEFVDNGWRRGAWDHGVAIYFSSDVRLSDVSIRHNRANGFYALASDHLLLERVSSADNGSGDNENGFLCQNSQHVVLYGCTAMGNGEDGIDLGGYAGDSREDMTQVVCENCTAVANRGEGFAISGDAGDAFATYGVLLVDCRAEDNDGVGLQIYERAHHVECRGCTLVGNSRGYNLIQQIHDVWLHDGVIAGNANGDGHIDGGLTNVVVENNQ